MNFPISTKNILAGLLVAVGILALLSLAGQFYLFSGGESETLIKLAGKLDLDGEKNSLPNWFQSSAMICCSILLLIIANRRRESDDPDFKYWGILSIVFVYLSLDESISIHEQATVPIRYGLDLHGPLFMSWVLPFGILTLFFGLGMFRFIMRQPANIRLLVMISGAIFVSGALVMEMIDGAYYEVYIENANGLHDWPYIFMTTVEETLESIGLSLFIYSLLEYLSSEALTHPAAAVIRQKKAASKTVYDKPLIARVR